MWRFMVLGLLALPCGCTNDVPCSACPPVEGAWELSYEEPLPGACPGATAPSPPSTLDVSRVGSSIRARLGAAELTGTLYDSFDLSVSAGGLSDAGFDQVTLRARFVPGRADGGDQLANGRLTATYRQGGAGPDATCSEQRAFTGRRR